MAELTALVYPTSDLEKSKELFSRALGARPVFDEPFYVGWQVGRLNVGLDPGGVERGMTGATPVFEVEDIRTTVDEMVAAGATLLEDVHNVGGGNLIALLKDADGNMIGLGQTP